MSGNDGEEVTPVPIPNTEVKLFSADGSWGSPPVRVGRCQASPYFGAILLFSFACGPLVKRLRHRPFTAVTRVRIPYGSPFYCGGLAQLGEHLPYKQRVGGSSPSSSTIISQRPI